MKEGNAECQTVWLERMKECGVRWQESRSDEGKGKRLKKRKEKVQVQKTALQRNGGKRRG